MVCDNILGVVVNKCLLTPYREPATEQSMETTEVQFDEVMSLTVATYKDMDEELLTRADMTQKQLHHKSQYK